MTSSPIPALDAIPDDVIEAASKAYAEATGYYVTFHAGLSSESSDRIRRGIRAALYAYLRANHTARADVAEGLIAELVKVLRAQEELASLTMPGDTAENIVKVRKMRRSVLAKVDATR